MPNQQWSDLARTKAEIIMPLLEFNPIPPDKMREAQQRAGALLGKQVGKVSPQSIRNWINAYKRAGITGLERKPRSTSGQSTLDPNVQHILRGLFLDPKQFSVAHVHRLIVQHLTEHGVDKQQIPTRKQVHYIQQHITPQERELAWYGTQRYAETYHQCTRFEAPHANAMWQVDHHKVDLIVIDPVTKERLGRPWLTVYIDDYSRAICGYYLSLQQPSSMSIALALHHAMLPNPNAPWSVVHGIPKKIYSDNGKDFLSKHIKEVAISFGIHLQHHAPSHPQSKGKVERFFGTLERKCICLLDGYVGHTRHKRPPNVTPRLSLQQLQHHLDAFLEDYHTTQHSTTRQSPRSRWLADQTTIRSIERNEDLDHLLPSRTYKVRTDGIRFRSIPYMDQEGELGKYIGQKITVFFNPQDTSEIRLWDTECPGKHRYICAAYPQTKQHRLTSEHINKNNAKERNAIKRSIQKDREAASKLLKKSREEGINQKETPQIKRETDQSKLLPPNTDEIRESEEETQKTFKSNTHMVMQAFYKEEEDSQ
jgi:putative transposase